MVSVKDIAAACGVSVATVSKALNDYSDVGEKTRALVRAKAAEMGYLPNMAAVALKTRRTYNLGILFVDGLSQGLKHEFFANVLQGIKSQAESEGYSITFITHRIGDRDVTYKEFCTNRQFDGIIIACVDYAEPEVLELISSSFPVVTIDHIFNDTMSVMSNNVAGMKSLMDYVYSKGHRKIAYIHGLDSSVTRHRVTSFYQCMQRYGLTIPNEYVMTCAYHDTQTAAQCTEALLDLPDPPTCILYPDDYTAIGGVSLITARGLSIPEDISVVGYDGISYAMVHEPNITTLLQASEEMGQKAVAQLIELIEHPDTTLPTSITLEGKLFEGGSVKELN